VDSLEGDLRVSARSKPGDSVKRVIDNREIRTPSDSSETR